MLPDFNDNLRVREAEHRYLNSLQILSVLTRRELRAAEGQEARASLTYLAELTDILADLHRGLKGASEVELGARLAVMSERWQRMCNGHVRFSTEIDETIVVSPRKAIDASLIVHELLMNALKHAFPDGRSGTIHVILRRSGPKHATLTVRDDGIGACAAAESSPARRPHDHCGAGLVETLALGLDGIIEQGPADGVGHSVSIRWPT